MSRRPVLLRNAAVGLLAAASSGCAHIGVHEPQVTEVRLGASEATDVDGYYGDAVGAIRARDYGRALDFLQLARRRAPHDVRLLNAFGVVYDKLGRFDLSARYYAEAIAIEPASPIVRSNVAYSQTLQRPSASPIALAAAPRAASPGALEPIITAERPQSPSVQRVELARVAAAPTTPMLLPPTPNPPAPGSSPTPVRSPPGEIGHASAALVAPVVRRAAEPIPGQRRIGPVLLVDASGHGGRARALEGGLKRLGWTTRLVGGAGAPLAARTVIQYPADRLPIARALARSLPGPVRLSVCQAACARVRVLLGSDLRAWRIAGPTLHPAKRA